MSQSSKPPKDNKKHDDHEPLWEAVKKSITLKKQSREYEGLLLQKKVEIKIRSSDLMPPKDQMGLSQLSQLETGSLDFKSKKKLSKKLTIDATLDLHGLTQIQALERLQQFVHRCFAHRLQNTLIITGKGRQVQKQRDAPEKGVLRRNLPLWLESPDLCGYIHYYTNTHPFEGGTGAFYVRLRRHKGPKPG